MIKVLFVCLGNICRSPMAEAIFRSMVEKEGLAGKIETDSAGTSSWHVDAPPHKGTLGILEKYKIPAGDMRSRQFSTQDADVFDYIIGMDESNLSNMKEIAAGKDHTRIIRLLDLTNVKKDVPDPYYTGDFEETYSLVTEGCAALLALIKEENSLE